MKQKKLQYMVPYETQWTHIDIGPQKPLHFAPNTPTREIVLRLQEYIKEIDPDSEPNYTKNVSAFGKVYRNIIPNHRGWQVAYRQPNSDEPFGPISERIGHQSQPKRYSPLKPMLQRPMRWINRQYPDIEPVVLGPVANCAVIARRLNQQIGEGCGALINNGQPMDKSTVQELSIKPVLQAWLPEINRLQTSIHELIQRADGELDLEQDSTWYTFSNCLKQLYKDCQKLKPKSANVMVSNNHINSVLYSHTQAAKGWRVEFLDGRASDH